MTHYARPARKRTTFQERKPRWIIIRDTLIMLFEWSPATPPPRAVAWFPIPAHRQVRGIADQLHSTSPSSIKKSVVRKTRCAVCRVVCRVVGHSLLLLGIPSSSFITPLTFSIQHFGLVTSKAPRSNQVAVHRRNEASVKCVSEVRLRSCR